MRITKKLALATVLSAVSAFAAVPSWAAFATVSKATVTASAVLSGAGQVAMSLSVRNVSNNAVAANVSWTGITLPFTSNSGWKVADQYILLNSTITAANGGIQIYTENRAADFTPKASTATALIAGLVDNTDNTKILPMAWAVRNSTVSVASVVPPAGDPDVIFQWLYFKDPGSASPDTLSNGELYATVKNATGIHFGPANTEFGAGLLPAIDYVFFQANFTNALTPRTYSGRIRIEAFTL